MPQQPPAVPLAVYKQVFDDLTEQVALTRLRDGVYLDVNPGFERMTGYRRDEVIGRSSVDLGMWACAEDRERYARSVLQSASGSGLRAGEPIALRMRRRDGELRDVEMTGSLFSFGGERIIVSVVHDVTERNQAARELAAHRANLEQLVAIRTRALGEAHAALTAAHEQVLASERLARFQAQHDALTGLANRVLLADRLEQAISRAERGTESLAVLLVDLDHFRRVNDSLGQQAGDELLRVVAKRLTSRMRKSDTVARLAGDQFVVALGGAGAETHAANVAQTLLALLAPPVETSRGSIEVQASIGVAVHPRDGTDVESLLAAADIALLQAKAIGGHNIQFHCAQMQQSAKRRLQTEIELRTALATGQFRLHYQPQVDMRSGRVLSLEALLRWEHPERGMVPPLEFIALAEETGLIVPLGEWVLREAARQLARWRRQGHAALRVAVNLSPRQIWAPGFVDMVRNVLAESGLPGGALDVEITESLLIKPTAENISTFERLAGLGLHLYIDDFGTGYSSLSYLKSYPIHALKIDRAFIRNIGENERDRAITSTIIAMARNLNLEVLAEGVETAEQARLLLESGCTLAQGYHFGRPMPADSVQLLLDAPVKGVLPTPPADAAAPAPHAAARPAAPAAPAGHGPMAPGRRVRRVTRRTVTRPV